MTKTTVLAFGMLLSMGCIDGMDVAADRLKLVCVPSVLGGGSAGMADGPERLLGLAGSTGILDEDVSRRMRKLFAAATVIECCQPDERERPYARNIAGISAVTRAVKDSCTEIMRRKQIPVILGGDSSAGFGLLAALSEQALQLGVASIGGYYGLQTPETTSSGDMQGMLLGAAAGSSDSLWYNAVDADTADYWRLFRGQCGQIEHRHMVFAGVRYPGGILGRLRSSFFEWRSGITNQADITMQGSADYAVRMNEALEPCEQTMLIFDAETALEGSALPGGLADVVAQRLLASLIDTKKVSGAVFVGYDSDRALEGMGRRVYQMLAHTVTQLDASLEGGLEQID